MKNYIYKIATKEEFLKKWKYEINSAKEDKNNWIIWKPKLTSVSFFVLLFNNY